MEPQAKSSEKHEDAPDNTVPAQSNDTGASSDPTAHAEVPLPQTAKPAAAPSASSQSADSPPDSSVAQSQSQQPQGNPDGTALLLDSLLTHFPEVVLFVSGFGYGLVDETFAALFTPYGKVVSCKVLIDIPTGKSKGCGLIRLENKKAAEAAMTALNGTTLPGQVTTLTVKVCTPFPFSPRRALFVS
jgi:hypothetical protein